MGELTRNVLLIALSAFFADMGYQAVIASFPILFVIIFKAPVYLLGFVYAIQYGGGALFGYLGGVASDRFGKKQIAILGNLFIPLLSFIGVAGSYFQAAYLFIFGWFARDSRSPARRALLADCTKESRAYAFGVLHFFDIGGGAISLIALVALLGVGMPLRSIIIFTIIPILISSVVLFMVRPDAHISSAHRPIKAIKGRAKIDAKTIKGVIIASSLFGFSFYSFGFPILTIAQESKSSIYGILSYLLFLAISALSGYIIGAYSKKSSPIKSLGVLGYLCAALGTFVIGLSVLYGHELAYIGVALLGFGVGAIETLEPTIISNASHNKKTGARFGALGASRSIGLFIGNIVMGVLYIASPFYSYMYAAIVSVAAFAIVLHFGSDF